MSVDTFPSLFTLNIYNHAFMNNEARACFHQADLDPEYKLHFKITYNKSNNRFRGLGEYSVAFDFE